MPRFRIPIIDIIFRSIRKFTKSLSIPNISVVLVIVPEREGKKKKEKKERKKGRKREREKERLTNEQGVNPSAV